MASLSQAQEVNEVPQDVAPQRFAIDLEWYSRTGRSLEELLRFRRCASCQEAIRGKETSITAQEHIQEIVQTCSKQQGYLEDRMPIMEVLFRILLAGGNEPMTAEEIHRELSAHLESRLYSRVLPLRWVERLLAGGNLYSIGPVNG